MRARPNPVEALVTLARVSDSAERRASWRQAIAALGQSVRIAGPPPLDNVPTDLLVRAAQVALTTGLADELDWIAPGPATVALFELSSALPAGQERRDLGRRIFARLYEGTASTFAAVATRMALGSGKQLDTPTLRARIQLIFDLPIGSSVNADALALALVTRRSLQQRWLLGPSTGPLPARRMAAKMLEHAAREAITRSQQSDVHAREQLTGATVLPTLARLLLDREPLVWRHAAVARGLLATSDARLQDEIEIGLDPALSPTEWRRSAVSLVAMLTGEPRTIMKRLRRVLEGDLPKADPGVAAAMVFGLPRVIEAEPDAAEELLDRLSATRRSDVAEMTAALLRNCHNPNFGARAAANLRAAVAARSKEGALASRALVDRAVRILGRSHLEDTSIAADVRRALIAYETSGARAAHELATQALTTAHQTLESMAGLDPQRDEDLVQIIDALSDLDESVLERSRLADLLLLSRRPGDADFSVPALERLHHALGNWVLEHEERAIDSAWSQNGEVVSQKRLRALLHLIDLDAGRVENDERVRARIRHASQVLLARLVAGPDASVHRILCATLARSFDAAIREGVAEPADLLVLVMQQLSDLQTIETLSDASLAPEMSSALAAYAAYLGRKRDPLEGLSDLDTDLPETDAEEDEASAAQRIVQLSRGLTAGGSYRAEALRQVILRLGRALEAIAQARGLSELVDTSTSGSGPVAELENATDALRQLFVGACTRLLGSAPEPSPVNPAPLTSVIERALSAGTPAASQQIANAISELSVGIPGAIEEAIAKVVCRLDTLPVASASDLFSIPLEKRRTALPDWLLPRRTIGAFYVVRALGAGGVSSVFVARRFEERHDPKAEAFALKVPEFDPMTARSLSEQQFLQMFRDEAGALLSLPSHPNLARFVTFDLAARPKPILVMELIRGFALDRLIRSRSLSTKTASQYLLGILSGLEAMHQVGVGHLDVKPSNVILRDGHTPVLVDFGLSGRALRPGCGTLEYCSPEVLGVLAQGATASAPAVDVYAFACTAFETLTGETLFDADDEMTLASMHVSHDGWPDKLVRYSGNPALSELCVVLAASLRHDPRSRPSAAQLRSALGAALRPLEHLPWPLVCGRALEAAS